MKITSKATPDLEASIHFDEDYCRAASPESGDIIFVLDFLRDTIELLVTEYNNKVPQFMNPTDGIYNSLKLVE